MEKSIRAFFYEYKYYLFPDNMTLEELKEETFLPSVKRLKEERCMAPDFIYESIAQEELMIENPSRLFEVEVNLYSGAEYDEILGRQVDLHCKDCECFIDNGDPSLDGHHREISLKGVCFLKRKEDEPWSFSLSVDYFWENVAERLSELADCIEQGNREGLNGILAEEMERFMPPAEFYGDKADGRYNLYLQSGKAVTPFMNEVYAFIAEAASQENSPIAKAGWAVHPFTPAGIATYRGKTEIGETDKIFYTVPSQSPFRFGIFMECSKVNEMTEEEIDGMINDLDRYLSAELGDDVVAAVSDGYEIVWDNENVISMSELKEKIRQNYESLKEAYNGDITYPFPVFYGMDEDPQGDWWLPYRNYIRNGSTTCPDASFLEKADLQGEKPWWLGYFTFAYLYVPRLPDGAENAAETLTWYLQNTRLVPEPLRDPEDTVLSGVNVGFVDCEERGFILDLLAMDEKRFFRLLRTLAPVLSAYDVKAVIVNKDGVNAYACGYEFTPVDFD